MTLDTTKKDAGSNGPNAVPPSYEDSVAAGQRDAAAPLLAAHPGYGASPYQPSHTARIVILTPNQGRPPPGAIRVAHIDGVRPTHPHAATPAAQSSGRRARPVTRFLAALFWAWMLYLTLCLVVAAIIEAAERNNKRHEKPGKRPEGDQPGLPPLPPPETQPPHRHFETTLQAVYKQLNL
ncbi:hypothetical protein CBOM_06943 [Ceraceosorus bombacis]|uniref:Uncharacterized protein n=1 Tax=Ceraceosorus bombacis TaxID=401625 RepID=A0A0N7LAJ1_9BASI|nr:hypothetical protein CBOM_06943 [Ceraceosorus bombacis]